MLTNFIPIELTNVSDTCGELVTDGTANLVHPISKQIVVSSRYFIFVIGLPFGKCIAMGFDELTDLRFKIDLFDIYDFSDGCGTEGADFGGWGISIHEEDMLAFYGAKPPAAAAERLITDGYAVCFEYF